MRKLFPFAAAAALAYFSKRGSARPGSRAGWLGALVPIFLAPRWMRPLMLARAVRNARRLPPR